MLMSTPFSPHHGPCASFVQARDDLVVSGLPRRVLVLPGFLLRSADVFYFLGKGFPQGRAHEQRTTRLDPNHLASAPPSRQPSRLKDPKATSWSGPSVNQTKVPCPPV